MMAEKDRKQKFFWDGYSPPTRIPQKNIEMILATFQSEDRKAKARKLLNEGRLMEAMKLRDG